MTSDRFENTMHEWLAERGAGRAPDRLHANTMTVIGARRQRVGWWARLRAGSAGAQTLPGTRTGSALRPFAVLALTLLLGAALGYAVASRPAVLPVSSESPQPTSQVPTPTPWALSAPVETSKFIKPFSYQLPMDTSSGFHLIMDEGDLQTFGFETGRVPGPVNYLNWQFESPRGVAVFALGTQETNACWTGGAATTPSKFLELLGTVVGTHPGIGPITPTTVDGRPALTTSFRTPDSTCSAAINYDLGHLPSKFLRTTIPSKFIAFELGDQTIVIDISAQDDAEFDAWLPFATQFVDSIHFEETPPASPEAIPQNFVTSNFTQPFEYTFSSYPEWRTDEPALYAFVDSREGLPVQGYGALQASAPRGIAVMPLDRLWIWPYVCLETEQSPVQIRTTAAGFIEDLHNVGRLSFDLTTQLHVDGRPALGTRVLTERSQCTADFWFDEAVGGFDQSYVDTGLPSQFFVVELSNRTVLIDVWAQTDLELDSWLPTAQEFVNSIHFI